MHDVTTSTIVSSSNCSLNERLNNAAIQSDRAMRGQLGRRKKFARADKQRTAGEEERKLWYEPRQRKRAKSVHDREKRVEMIAAENGKRLINCELTESEIRIETIAITGMRCD